MQVIEPYPSYVDQRGIERVGIGQSTLLRVGGLIALLETAPIRSAPKDAGDELRIVYVAKSEKELVLLIEVNIHSRIERIAMLEEFRGVAEIVAAGRRSGRVRVQVEECDRILMNSSRRDHVQS